MREHETKHVFHHYLSVEKKKVVHVTLNFSEKSNHSLKMLCCSTKSSGAALFESDHLLCSLWQLSIYFRLENGNLDREKKLNKAEDQY